MICETCKNSGILNYANQQPFWFCKQCRIEILPMSVSQSTDREDDVVDVDEPWDPDAIDLEYLLSMPVPDDNVDLQMQLAALGSDKD